MGCGCNERRAELVRAVGAASRGDIRTALDAATIAGRTFAEDVRSGALKAAAGARLAASG
jgi:hypothetical protein